MFSIVSLSRHPETIAEGSLFRLKTNPKESRIKEKLAGLQNNNLEKQQSQKFKNMQKEAKARIELDIYFIIFYD